MMVMLPGVPTISRMAITSRMLMGLETGINPQIMPLYREVVRATPPRQSGRAAPRDVQVAARKTAQVGH
jgi:hypothetical protein